MHSSTLLGLINLALTIYLIVLVRKRSRSIMADLAQLETSVANETTVEQSAIALLNGLSQQLKDALASGDPARIQAIIDHVDANSAALAAAVTANTPATTAPPATA
ncbi:MAG: hypothetical protein JST28_09245 [Acidobacteria bacterium]|nr:hypothetical protein [Acidobacteriota bacterium]